MTSLTAARKIMPGTFISCLLLFGFTIPSEGASLITRFQQILTEASGSTTQQLNNSTAQPKNDSTIHQKSLFDLMSYQEVLPITITTDLDTIRSYRNTKDDVKSTMQFQDSNGDWLEWKAKIEIRGRYRRTHCSVPPLKLNFKKSELREAGLAVFDDVDVVTQCLEDPIRSKELVVKEYLAYKLYNEITEYSYRVQMVKMTFRNEDTGKEDEIWGFFIEDTAELSSRISATKLDTLIMSPEDLHEETFNQMALFQSMIGNVDWGVNPAKNVKFFRDEQSIYAIPYDFDFSAIVNAPYARFSINMVLRSELQLKMLDDPDWSASMRETLNYYRYQRQALLNTIQKTTVLSPYALDEVVRLVDAYLNNPYRMVLPIPDLGLMKEQKEEKKEVGIESEKLRVKN